MAIEFTPIKDSPIERMASYETPEVVKPKQVSYLDEMKNLDSDKANEIHGDLMAKYKRELDRQMENRAQMAIDEDYYDNIQWTEEDMQVLRERGQAPIVYNAISQSVNWIIGSEKRGRSDFKILPRQKEDSKPAERKTQILKYLSDVNRTPYHRSRAFEDAVKVGIGWVEDGVTDDPDREIITSRYLSLIHISEPTRPY